MNKVIFVFLLYSFQVFSSTSEVFIEGIVEKYDETTEYTDGDSKESHDDFLLPHYLFPSAKYAVLNDVQNRHTAMYYSIGQGAFLPPDPAIRYEEGGKIFFPQSAYAQLLQALFPRVDGLVPNRMASTYLAMLTPQDIARLIRSMEGSWQRYHEEPSSINAEDHLTLLRNALPVSKKVKVNLAKLPLHTFAKMDVQHGMACAAKILYDSYMVNIQDIDGFARDRDFDVEETQQLAKVLTSSDPIRIVMREMFGDSQAIVMLPEYLELAEGEGVLYADKIRYMAHVAHMAGMSSGHKTKHEKLVRAYRKEVFLHTLNTAFLESLKDSHRSVQQLLVAYFWTKNPTYEEIYGFYNELLGNTLTQKRLVAHTAEDIVASLQEGVPRSLQGLKPYERQYLLWRFNTLYSDPFVPKAQTAHYKGNSFPDCVEMVFFPLLRSLIRQQDDTAGRVYYDTSFFESTTPAHAYFTHYPTPAYDRLPEAREIWIDYVTNLPETTRIRYNENSVDDVRYELLPGMYNFLAVMCYMIGIPYDIAWEENMESLHHGFKTVSRFFSRKDCDVEFVYDVDEYHEFPSSRDYLGQVDIEKNGEAVASVEFTAVHAKYLSRHVNERPELDLRGAHPLFIAPLVRTEEDLIRLYETYTLDGKVDLFSALNSGNAQVISQAVRLCLTSGEEALYPIAQRLLGVLEADHNGFMNDPENHKILEQFMTGDIKNCHKESLLQAYPSQMLCVPTILAYASNNFPEVLCHMSMQGQLEMESHRSYDFFRSDYNMDVVLAIVPKLPCKSVKVDDNDASVYLELGTQAKLVLEEHSIFSDMWIQQVKHGKSVSLINYIPANIRQLFYLPELGASEDEQVEFLERIRCARGVTMTQLEKVSVTTLSDHRESLRARFPAEEWIEFL